MDNNKADTSVNNEVDQNGLSKEAAKEFKIVIMIVLLILVIFLCLFVYNLIKCYLPKWRNKREFVGETDTNSVQGNARKLEMYEP